MRYPIVRFIFGIIVLCSGIGATAIWMLSKTIYHKGNAEKNQLVSQAPRTLRMEFQWKGETLLGPDPKHPSGFIGGFSHDYEASDGVPLFQSGLSYSSPAGANRELRKKLMGALRIIERGPNLDENGKKVGERVVAIFPFFNTDGSSSSNKTTASILWTNKNNFGYIESSTIEHVLEFEKHHRNY